VTPVDIRRDRDSEGHATPLPSRDPRHRAPAVARPPDRANPCNRPTRFATASHGYFSSRPVLGCYAAGSSFLRVDVAASS
jgi:hypothetical protein